ncbi:hypothetical protein SO802_010774 [Lithocarpus litseifolius]|uniref:Wall-associated receptor kinase galacturonan-binding domain-containing protein n=1 Tax=Lithocarpus litseifolius TaxID=425828 RepID=A0AAW2DHD0_9ROSI
MAEAMVVFHIIVLLGSMNAFVKAVGLVNSSCSQSCGNVSIPYPFGIEPGCYISDSYRIYCNHSFSPPKPTFSTFTQMEVLDISLEGTLRVNYPTLRRCSNGTETKPFESLAARSLVFSQSRNKFIAIGCNNFASLNDAEDVVICGCMSVCNNKTRAMNGNNSCNGINCCQTTIPSDLQDFSLSLQPIDPKHDTDNPSCKYAFIVEQKWFETNLTNPFEIQNMSHVPVVLEWLIDSTLSSHVLGNNLSHEYDDINSTYRCSTRSSSVGTLKALTCSCKPGFEGNPYFPDPQVPERCTDIDECIGSPCLVIRNDSSGNTNYSRSFRCENTRGSYRCLPLYPFPTTKTSANAITIVVVKFFKPDERDTITISLNKQRERLIFSGVRSLHECDSIWKTKAEIREI